MSDIEKSFTFLNDSIPSWLKDVAEIEEKIVIMQSEIAKVPVSRSPPMRRKTGSVESIRDLDAIVEEAGTSGAGQSNPFVSRKRKNPSLRSTHASSPSPSSYRSRTMIIVHYDGQIQKSFESLVRSIGAGRNMLRKGKMAAKMEELAALAGSDDDDDEDDDADDAVLSKIGYRRRPAFPSMRSRMPMRGARNGITANGTSADLFDTTDKALELAQGLCERAAHQSLRDGDCRKELSGVRKHFQDVLETAAKEVEKCNARKEKEQEMEDQAAREETKAETPTVKPAPIPVALSIPIELELEAKPTYPVIHTVPITAPLTSKGGTMEIEVDDDDDDDIDFVMPPIRLTSRA